ncbi:MAG: tripartite tricarboxylate transporter substrate binding protein [Betaproteobacteria bacterium]|nr:tripartite tricarboxylate transporter substrate binding protein [Betaproteobacteria bacterium]MDH5341241.1 tripartite tricarboxylate transporter substrate binding protein [Betaproteobacteria bacterium]
MQALRNAVLFLVLSAVAGTAFAQNYPTRPIRIIVAYTPAGTTDILARAVGQKMTEAWGQTVIVDNRPGANGNIGTELTANATPDGYTIVMGTAATHSINNTLYPTLKWDAVKNFAPISLVAQVPNILVVNNSLPVKSVKELIAYGNANPGKLNHGSPGLGSTGHLCAELFKGISGVKMTHVPYKGSAPTLADLAGGQIQVVIDNLPPYLPHVQAGKIRGLAVTTAKRSAAAPNLPTMQEAGVAGYEAGSWFGLLAPAGTPKAIVQKLSGETARILKLPEVNERLSALGATPVGSTPEEFAAFIRNEQAKWRKVIQQANIKL